MKIQVFTPQGKKVEVEVNPGDTISDVQDKVEREAGLDKDTQRFLIHGDRNVFQEPMKIYVRDTKGWKFLLDNMDPLDTIGDIKQKIEYQESIPKKDQFLLFGETPLNDDFKTLFDCGIKHKSILDLEPMTIFIKTTKGEVFELMVQPTNTVEDIKKQISEERGIALDEIILTANGDSPSDFSRLADCGIRHRDTLTMNPLTILVKDATNNGKGKVYTFEYEATDTIEDIKNTIVDVVGIPMYEQLLSYEGEMLIRNGKSLRECGLKHQSMLILEQMKIRIKTFQGDKFRLAVEPSDTLQSIKERVLEKTDIPLKDQVLFLFDDRLNDMNMTLMDCGVQHNDKIEVEEHMKVIVQDDTIKGGGKTYTFYTEETFPISKIAEMIADEVGIPRGDQLLSFNDSMINEDSMDTTLKDHEIQHRSTIHLVQMMINIETFQGDAFDLPVEQTDSLQSIKDRILEMKGIPLIDQILFFNNKRLDDMDMSLLDCGIYHLDGLNVEEHMKVNVKDDTKNGGGKTYLLYTEATYPISKIAEMIVEQVGIPRDDQILSFKQSLIFDKDMGTTLKKYGIEHKSTIHLVQMVVNVTTFQGDSFDLSVDQTDTLHSIKDRVLEMKGIPLVDQILWYKDERKNDMNLTLLDCGIQHLDKLIIEEHMKVFVKDDTRNGGGEVYTFYTEETDPIDKISGMIVDVVGIPKETQLLSFKDTLIEEVHMGMPLTEYGIKHKAKIHCVQMKIKINTFQGDKFKMDVERTDTLQSIKQRILEKKDIPLKDQILFFDGERLDDTSLRLVDCGIEHNDKLVIEEHMKVIVQDDTKNGGGKTYLFYTEQTYPLSKIAEMIVEEVGIPRDDQILSYEQSLIFDEDMNATLKQYGIKHKSTIHLVQMIVNVTTFQGDSFDLSVGQTDSLQSIKDRVLEMKGIPLKDQLLWFDNERLDDMDKSLLDCGIEHLGKIIIEEHMKVLVKNDTKNGGGKVYTFYTEETYPISQIAKMIEAEVGIPKNDQLLQYEEAMISDEDLGTTLKDYGIKHKSTIHAIQMQIRVKTFQGDKFKMSVEKTDKVEDIMNHIEETKEIPVRDQILWFGEERLSDKKMTLTDCGIKHLDRIVVEEHMKVTVQDDTKNGGGKTHLFYVEETFPLSKIAEMIESEAGIPKNDQLLEYEDAMISDEDMGRSLNDYGIKHKTTIHAIQMQINIKTFQGDKFILEVEKTDKIQDIMNRIKEMTEIPLKDQILWFGEERLGDKKMSLTDCGIKHLDAIVVEEHMKVTVQDDTNNGGGKTHLFYVEETFPLSKIAEMIAEEVGIPEETQLLSYEKSLIDSKDMGRTLKGYGIKHKTTIHAIQMMVAVETFQGDKFDFAVEQTDTLQSIKDRVLDKTGIPLIDQVLFSDESRLDDMDQTLVECGIHHLDKIMVEEHMKVNVQDDTKDGGGKVYTFYTQESMQISQIMDMIADEVKVPKKKQLLSYEETLVYDKDMTSSLKDYGIKHQSTLHLVQMMITVKTWKGDTFMMTVDPNDKCQGIKKKVEEMKGIPVNDQILVFDDRKCRNFDSLKLVGIKHGDTVYINEAMKVNVQDDTRGANGKIYTFYMEETDTIHDVAMLIEAKVGIEKDKQRMTFNDEKLEEEDKTLKDCGIKHDDTIHVKKSYIPVDWKKTVEEKYGKVKITTYEVDYTLETGVIKGVKDEREETIDITGRRRSEMVQAQKEFMANSPMKSPKKVGKDGKKKAGKSPKKTPKKKKKAKVPSIDSLDSVEE